MEPAPAPALLAVDLATAVKVQAAGASRVASRSDGPRKRKATACGPRCAGAARCHPVVDTSRRVLGAALWGREGSSRVRDAPVADPAIIRSLDVGQAAYIHRGGVTFVQVKRLVAAPAALAREPAPAPAPAPEPAAAHPEPAAAGGPPPTAPLPDASSLLDEAFGNEPPSAVWPGRCPAAGSNLHRFAPISTRFAYGRAQAALA